MSWQHRIKPFKEGDRVGYTTACLREQGKQLGPEIIRTGTIKEIIREGEGLTACVAWDDGKYDAIPLKHLDNRKSDLVLGN